MADVADGQGEALKNCHVPGPGVDAYRLAQAAYACLRCRQALASAIIGWRDILSGLLEHMAGLPELAPLAAQTGQARCTALDTDRASMRFKPMPCWPSAKQASIQPRRPSSWLPYRSYGPACAADFNERDLPVVSPKGVCPSCGSLPVASVVQVGGQADGCRYLCCSLCAAEWHLVRVTCSHCEDTKEVAYHSIEGGPDGIKAESCDHCRSYRKIFYQEKVLCGPRGR